MIQMSQWHWRVIDPFFLSSDDHQPSQRTFRFPESIHHHPSSPITKTLDVQLTHNALCRAAHSIIPQLCSLPPTTKHPPLHFTWQFSDIGSLNKPPSTNHAGSPEIRKCTPGPYVTLGLPFQMISSYKDGRYFSTYPSIISTQSQGPKPLSSHHQL